MLALASIGLSLVYGTTGLSNFAHAEQVTLGGLLVYVFAIQLGLPFLLAAVIAIAICALTGTVQDRLIWQPLRKRGLGLTQLMVVTIGLQLALEYLYQFVFGAGVLPVTTTIQVNTGPLNITPNGYLSMLISIVVLVAVGVVLLRTRIGRATRAVADNRALAAASGIDVDRIIRLVWTVSTGLAGLAGILYALVYGGIAWNTGAELLLLIFAAVTLGGLGTAFGALVGSLIIGSIVQLSSLVLSAELKYATALLILILVLRVPAPGHPRPPAARRLSERKVRPWTSSQPLHRRRRADPVVGRPLSFAIAAIGLDIHFGYTGLLNIGQAGFMLLGAYGFAITVKFGGPFWLGVLVAIVVAILFAFILGVPTLKLRGDYLAIVTIAAAEIVRIIGGNRHAATDHRRHVPASTERRISPRSPTSRRSRTASSSRSGPGRYALTEGDSWFLSIVVLGHRAAGPACSSWRSCAARGAARSAASARTRTRPAASARTCTCTRCRR